MYASVFATIFWTAFEATALKALAWIAFLVTLILIDSLAGRIASSREGSGQRSARPSRGGVLYDRDMDESLAGMSKALVPVPPLSDADDLGRMSLVGPEAGASAPGEWAYIEAGR